MKRIIYILLMLAYGCSPALSQTKQQVIVYPGYTSYYNPDLKIPDSVVWVAKPHVKAVGREAGFHSTGGRQVLTRDYSRSGYDIGHNCDASDENGNKTDEYNSFDYANTFPQRPNNNRRVWLAIENYTRKLNQPVKVKVSWSGILGYIGPDKVAIPTLTIKEIWYLDKYEKYVVPNQDTVTKHLFTYYRVISK